MTVSECYSNILLMVLLMFHSTAARNCTECNWFGWWKRACRGVGFPSTFPLADIPASTGMFGCPVGCRLVKLGKWKFPPYVSGSAGCR